MVVVRATRSGYLVALVVVLAEVNVVLKRAEGAIRDPEYTAQQNYTVVDTETQSEPGGVSSQKRPATRSFEAAGKQSRRIRAEQPPPRERLGAGPS